MESQYDKLPVILVSAKDTRTAQAVISEIIDNEPPDVDKGNEDSPRYIWRIVNKYYTADVRFHPLADGEELQIDENLIEGHVIYLEEDECTEATAQRRAAAARGAARRGVRLALPARRAGDAAGGAALARWAAAARRELVRGGVRRARLALHAHAWRGLRRTDGPAADAAPLDESSSEEWAGSASEEEAEEEGGEEEVERAELFAAALGALPAAAAAVRGEARREEEEEEEEDRAGREARLQRAEQLVAAFCRALGRR
ncbi:uncharacterized protein LOC113517911 [Galleria mellonella]|uniref:Uncharacterized protein LOC113517911 n=1 Tax=Galleria mellonella TaxID=7137 RepID=A0ABM3MBI5_GALME|nr:uncharacterized protein LOC113517911 [Galleria mellonella]